MKEKVVINRSAWKPISWCASTYCPHCGQMVTFSNGEILKIVSLKCRNCEKEFEIITKTFD